VRPDDDSCCSHPQIESLLAGLSGKSPLRLDSSTDVCRTRRVDEACSCAVNDNTDDNRTGVAGFTTAHVVNRLAASLKTRSLVAAEVTRLTLVQGIVGQSEPPYVGCYFFIGLLGRGRRIMQFSLRRRSPLAVNCPRYAEAIDQHAKTNGPERLLKLHFHRPFFCQRLEYAFRLRRILEAKGQ